MDIRLLGALVLVMLAAVHINVVYRLMRATVKQRLEAIRDDPLFLTAESRERELRYEVSSYLELLGWGYVALTAAWVALASWNGVGRLFEMQGAPPAYLFVLAVVAISTVFIIRARIMLHVALFPRASMPQHHTQR